MSIYIISLSLFIFLTSITTTFKLFFVKKDNLLDNTINFTKYTGISFFIFLLSFIMLSIFNSDLNFKLFTELRISFIILFCFLLFCAFNIFNEKNNISVEQYRKDDLYQTALKFFLFAISIFLNGIITEQEITFFGFLFLIISSVSISWLLFLFNKNTYLLIIMAILFIFFGNLYFLIFTIISIYIINYISILMIKIKINPSNK